MSAHTVVRQPSLIGQLRQRRTVSAAAATTSSNATAGQELPAPGRAVRLTGASMRFLEMGLAGAAIATALLLGVGR